MPTPTPTSKPTTDPAREAAIEALLAFVARVREAVLVTVETARQGSVTFRLPPLATAGDGNLTEVERDILAVLEAHGQRLTKDQLKAKLLEAGHDWSDSAIEHSLAALTGSKGRPVNKRDARGRDYGLASWG